MPIMYNSNIIMDRIGPTKSKTNALNKHNSPNNQAIGSVRWFTKKILQTNRTIANITSLPWRLQPTLIGLNFVGDEIFWRWRKFGPTKNLVRRKFGPNFFLKCHRKWSIKGEFRVVKFVFQNWYKLKVNIMKKRKNEKKLFFWFFKGGVKEKGYI